MRRAFEEKLNQTRESLFQKENKAPRDKSEQKIMRLKQRLENVSLETEKEMRRRKSNLDRTYLQLESDVEIFVENDGYSKLNCRLEKLSANAQAAESKLEYFFIHKLTN